MAVATATLTENAYPLGRDTTQRRFHTYGLATITASPATYATGGVVPSFAKSVEDVSSQTPIDLDLKSVSGSGYVYGWVKSTGKIQIFTVEAVALSTQYALTELANAATIPSAVSADIIAYHAQFLKFI